MAKKHKTVKELNIEVENLSERLRKLEEKEETDDTKEDTKTKFDGIEDMLKGYDRKISELDRTLKEARSGKEELRINNGNPISFKCKDCDNIFANRNELRKHMRNLHPKVRSCKNCEETFMDNWRLELHMKSHEEIKTFNCEVCDKKFYANWRKNKHQASHDEQNKFCHYFNNAKSCPFEELGCMYIHKISDQCKFDKNCNFKLCQFQHSRGNNSVRYDIHNENENNFGDESMDKHDEENDASEVEDAEDIAETDVSLTDDETEIIYQRFLDNYSRRESESNENKDNKQNGENKSESEKYVSEIMQNFTFKF